jgi:hypothetical protein
MAGHEAPTAAAPAVEAPAPPLAYIAAHASLTAWARAFNWYADRPKPKD